MAYEQQNDLAGQQFGCLPLIDENRLLCPGCRSADLEPHITDKRHQIVLRCRQCSRVTFLPLRTALAKS
jgi:hypothetical protein